MEQTPNASNRIIHAVAESPGCLLDDLVSACPGLTWNQVFFAVDRLSRIGQVQLVRAGVGQYAVRLLSPVPPQLANAMSVRRRASMGPLNMSAGG